MNELARRWWETLYDLPYNWQLAPKKDRDGALAAHLEATRALLERALEVGAEELEPMPDEPRRTHTEDVALWKRVARDCLPDEEG